jgi:hypothetical protein
MAAFHPLQSFIGDPANGRRRWLGQMGLSIGGETYRRVNEQARRISACTLIFFSDRMGSELMRRGGFVDGAITMTDALSDQPGLWQDRVYLWTD